MFPNTVQCWVVPVHNLILVLVNVNNMDACVWGRHNLSNHRLSSIFAWLIPLTSNYKMNLFIWLKTLKSQESTFRYYHFCKKLSYILSILNTSFILKWISERTPYVLL